MIANSYPFIKLDYTLPPEQLVIDLINNDNGTNFIPGQILFSTPKLIYNARHNTSVIVTASKDSYWTGTTKLHYNRIDIKDVTTGKSKVFKITTENNLSDLIPAIDARFKLKLTDADYIYVPLPLANDPEGLFVELEAAPTSLIFIERLTLKIDRLGQALLSVILKNFKLNGLIYTKPLLPILIDY